MKSQYQPIENYGVIGNMRTAALVGMNGSIDWYCFPSFDSPSVFGALLDEKKGGSFSISPAMEHAARTMSRGDAAAKVVDLIEKMVEGRQ